MAERALTVTIRPMAEADLPPVLAIEGLSFARPWTREHFLAELRAPHALTLVAQLPDGTLAGYFCGSVVLDEAEVLDIAVDPARRGTGLGARLLQAGLDGCRQRGAVQVHLEVRASNQAAIALYQRFAFSVTGRRPRYYENGEDALLMGAPLAAKE